ncbi:type I polyketide synthase [Herpetosiphon giganteus]|uniref:type I polyketide synthase n=1 Tax=Herpetosiphon giganteus TaxID=2029754 RepID=UPI001959042D|nr:type I polyketide synthase [Herpetosiphon giganteus]MBM7845190.1 acyl transferase domain-containing protein/acyl carrier protein [Herpetosiphon giganteus]
MLNQQDSQRYSSALDGEQLAEQPKPNLEPIAIIGIGCHFPGGAVNPATFWDLLCAGVDATSETPHDRWDIDTFYDPETSKSGKMNTYRGGYLEQIDQFDPHFFGISPREAMWLDPQQRLLLRVTWEAFEDAGLCSEQIAGSKTGVFVGGFTLDYQLMQNFGVFSRYELQAHSATGMMMTMLANRLSYIFDLHGPSMAIDTACSGSLVAVHLACQSLWNGESTMAIAGGANIMLAPTMTIAESKGGFLAPDGRCKAFSAEANGYARGEGAAVVVLKPLAQAQADGDPIYAVIRGTAVTQDGRTNGITVPNGESQAAAMRLAYHRAGVDPSKIGYVEAHGTGTPVGDPIEARAIGSVVAADRAADQPCIIGSVKTNIGHLEAAAGIAGLIKASLVLKHQLIPPHLHFQHANPAIPFEALRLRIPTVLESWPASDQPRFAGVNSFGFGGTNAHVLLEEAPIKNHVAIPASTETPIAILPISARSADALQALAARYCDFLEYTSESFQDILYSAAKRRTQHNHRLAIVTHSAKDAASKLTAFLAGDPHPEVAVGLANAHESPKIVFVCAGMGPQWWAMGRELIQQEPVFRAWIERCDTAFAHYSGWSLLEAMVAPEATSRMAETEVAQPANFAIQVALAELWRSWGIVPDAIVGHSAGEVAAHYLAGVLSFDDAMRVIYYRSQLQQRTTGQGSMLAVGMTPETLNQAIHETGNQVSIAAINSPSAVTLVGDTAILEDMARQLATYEVFHRFLKVKVPYHSHYMDPLREELLAALAQLSPKQAVVPLYSTVTGTRFDGRRSDAEYWWQNVRATVLFSSALDHMIQDGYQIFVELSPHPVLASPMSELLSAQKVDGVVLPSLRRGEHEQTTIAASLSRLYTLGAALDWQKLVPNKGTFVPLPMYPWQLKAYWTESVESFENRVGNNVHPLLGRKMSAVYPTWEVELNPRLLPYLNDHQIQGNILFPGAGFIEMALAAAQANFGAANYILESIEFRKALLVSPTVDPRLQTVLNPQRATVEIYSYTATAESRWTLHATVKLRQRQQQTQRNPIDLAGIEQRSNGEISREVFYQQSQQMGFHYGPTFQAIQHVIVGTGESLGRLQAPEAIEADRANYFFHPSLLDAAFQVLLTAARPQGFNATDPITTPYLPVGIDRLQWYAGSGGELLVHARIRSIDHRMIVGDIQIVDTTGVLIAEIEGFRAQSLSVALSLSTERLDQSLYELEWHPHPCSENVEQPLEGTWLVFTDQTGVGAALLTELTAQGLNSVSVTHSTTSQLTQDGQHYSLNPQDNSQFVDLFSTLAATNTACSHMIYLWGLDTTFDQNPTLAAIEQAQIVGTQAVVALLQGLTQSGWNQLPRLWIVTCGAQAVGALTHPLAIDQAPLWGLGRVIGHQEFANMWGGLIDLDRTTAQSQSNAIIATITQRDSEDQVAYRNDTRYVARLIPSTRLTSAMPPTFRADGSYLLTGGFGALGLLVAQWMVEHGARRLILMGRTALPPRSEWSTVAANSRQAAMIQSIRALESQGASIHVAALDVADEPELRLFLTNYMAEGWPPIRGVMHIAGVVEDDLLLRMKRETFQKVLRPKIHGSWLLHEMLRDAPLDFFILFSSTGSVITALGQANYAAANAFLDALAHYRHQQGLPALSIGWGPWSFGMIEHLNLEEHYTKRGIDLITPEIGTQMLGRMLSQQPNHLIAISANWATVRNQTLQDALPPMFSLLGQANTDTSGHQSQADESFLLTEISNLPAEEQSLVVVEYLQELIGHALRLEPAQLGEHESLLNLGMDSMMAIEVKRRVESTLKVNLSVLELLQGSTIKQLASRLLSQLQPVPIAETQGDAEQLSLTEIERLIEQTDSSELERLLMQFEQSVGSNNAV